MNVEQKNILIYFLGTQTEINILSKKWNIKNIFSTVSPVRLIICQMLETLRWHAALNNCSLEILVGGADKILLTGNFLVVNKNVDWKANTEKYSLSSIAMLPLNMI